MLSEETTIHTYVNICYQSKLSGKLPMYELFVSLTRICEGE